MQRVYFDVSVIAWESKEETLRRQVRSPGTDRSLYASDSPPLAAQLNQIAANIAPHRR